MRHPQITAHVPATVHERFRRYVERIGMRDSEVAKLLILRERSIRRIKSNAPKGEPKRRPQSKAKVTRTVTAHMTSAGQVTEFHVYANGCGLSRSAAAAFLVARELEERWLERSISTP